MGSGPSPPTKPLANSLNDVDDLTDDEGANAEAVAARVAAMIADFMVIVVMFLLVLFAMLGYRVEVLMVEDTNLTYAP